MKCLVLLFSLAFCNAYTQQVHSIDTSYANLYYQEKIKEFQNEVSKPNAIVFIGNSITEVGPWENISAQYPIVNRGISGDNTFGVYHRLQNIIDLKPNMIFIMIGVNDIKRGTPLDLIIRNHHRIIKTLQKGVPETKIVLQSILPVNETMLANIYSRINNKVIDKLNKVLESIARAYDIDYLDLNQHFLKRNSEMPEYFTTDGLHLTNQGYAHWVDFLTENKFLNK